ncbi:uncharacterized protein [Epargyreus clarus]|uniref:uncharacterized protein n=1 Tax=Epargyreus clarus TaxID=520877 RepID=UPI003C2D91B7
MKYFIALALIAAVASARLITGVPTPQLLEDPEIMEIIAAIHSPSTDPATAAMLEQLLHELLDALKPEPIHVGPEIVDHPISVGPEIIDFPVPETVVDPTPVDIIAVNPVAPAPAPASSPLVQIIVNVQQSEAAPVHPNPIDVVDMMPVMPVIPEEHPIDIVDIMPVIVPEPTPVLVVDEAPAPLEPVNVAPIIVAPVVVAPEILN